MGKYITLIFVPLIISCIQTTHSKSGEGEKQTFLDSIFVANPQFVTDGFDFPVGKPNAKHYYNAQKFKVNNHLGDDWNGTGGGNTDLGDPIYSIANGYVRQAKDEGTGWGNVIRIIHQLPNGTYMESLYAHCQEMKVTQGELVNRGQKIATSGNANGTYYAHLHLEIRTDIDMPLGGGYSSDTAGFVDPTWFIENNRP